MLYRPLACNNTYRLIVVRKNLSIEKGELRLFDDYLYFFYLTNDWTSKPATIVLEANQRCNQENLNAQLKGGMRALTAPVDNLESNWAYMVMTALAWNLKAWFALWPTAGPGHHIEHHQEEKQTILADSLLRRRTKLLLLSVPMRNSFRNTVGIAIGAVNAARN